MGGVDETDRGGGAMKLMVGGMKLIGGGDEMDGGGV